jgi:hypothetical protein
MALLRPDTLPKLTGNNYASWCSEMLDLLGLDDTVEEQHVVVSFLAGLGPDYEAVADSLAARGIKDLDEAELALLAVEQRILDRTGRDRPVGR